MQKLKRLIENLLDKLKNNTSFFYYSIAFISIIGFLFFTNSNKLFNKNIEIRSTNLNEIQKSNNLSAKILSRKYNNFSKEVEFIIYVNDQTNFDGKELDFQLREQNNPKELIQTRYKKIDKDYYVIFAKVPKKWKVLSLSLGYKENNNLSYENDLDTTLNTNDTLISIIRIYSDINDIKINSLMNEKSSNKYFDEIMSLEIKNLNTQIDEINKKINSENEKINDAKIKISELEGDKKYQTESEQNLTDSNINKLENVISNSKKFIEDNSKLVKELKEKIKIFSEKSKKNI